jgi:hypothetical protein
MYFSKMHSILPLFFLLLSEICAASTKDIHRTNRIHIPISREQTCSNSGLLRIFSQWESCSVEKSNITANVKNAKSSVWTLPPKCISNATEHFCSYTSQLFHHGRGFTVITNPDSTSEIYHLLSHESSLASSHISPPNPPPFAVKQIQGRGMGVIANRTIERGEVLFAHAIIGMFNNEAFPTSPDHVHSDIQDLFLSSIEGLPAVTREKFWALAAHEEDESKAIVKSGKGVIGRLNTNTFGEEFDGEEHSLVVPETAVCSCSFLVVTLLMRSEKENEP